MNCRGFVLSFVFAYFHQICAQAENPPLVDVLDEERDLLLVGNNSNVSSTDGNEYLQSTVTSFLINIEENKSTETKVKDEISNSFDNVTSEVSHLNINTSEDVARIEIAVTSLLETNKTELYLNNVVTSEHLSVQDLSSESPIDAPSNLTDPTDDDNVTGLNLKGSGELMVVNQTDVVMETTNDNQRFVSEESNSEVALETTGRTTPVEIKLNYSESAVVSKPTFVSKEVVSTKNVDVGKIRLNEKYVDKKNVSPVVKLETSRGGEKDSDDAGDIKSSTNKSALKSRRTTTTTTTISKHPVVQVEVTSKRPRRLRSTLRSFESKMTMTVHQSRLNSAVNISDDYPDVTRNATDEDDGGSGGGGGGVRHHILAGRAGERDNVSDWGSFTWIFMSGFVTALVVTGMCYLIIKSRRTNTYRLREGTFAI